MATDRRPPCLYYVCAGLCTKGRLGVFCILKWMKIYKW